MTDLELTEKCAKWLGFTLSTMSDGSIRYSEPSTVYIKDANYSYVYRSFDPLNTWNDLMTMVVPKLPRDVRIVVGKGEFILGRITKKGMLRKSLSDLPRAILELIAEMEEGK